MSTVSDLISSHDIRTSSPIKDFYDGKNVFLTGCTGAVGEVILEKLLRCGTNRIYVLCRAKKGVSAQERLATQFKSPLFEKVASLKPDFMKRIHIIYGDIKTIGLSISAEQRAEVINAVDIVIHFAADINFEQPLPDIILTNVRGTREVLTLAKEMKKLLAIAYCSTAYSHCVRLDIEEKFYRTPIESTEAIRLAEHFSKINGDELNVLTKRLIAPWPNVYTFSKAIAEDLIERATKELPILLIRPSIVLPTRSEPIPGYGTNFYGLTGYYVACFVGLLRVNPGNSQKCCLVCADDVCNGTLVAIWDRACVYRKRNIIRLHSNILKKLKEIFSSTNIDRKTTKIYNISFPSENLIQDELVKALIKELKENPLDNFVCMPVHNPANNEIYMTISLFLSTFLPAILLESCLRLIKSEKRVLPLFRKVIYFQAAMRFFSSFDWIVRTNNMSNLWKQMTAADRECFPCDLNSFKWSDFVGNYWFGIKAYLMKQSMDPKSLAKAKSNVFKIKCIYYGLMSVWNVVMFALAYYYSLYLPLILSLIYQII